VPRGDIFQIVQISRVCHAVLWRQNILYQHVLAFYCSVEADLKI
jgi:hypothetical protein